MSAKKRAGRPQPGQRTRELRTYTLDALTIERIERMSEETGKARGRVIDAAIMAACPTDPVEPRVVRFVAMCSAAGCASIAETSGKCPFHTEG